MWLSMFSSCVHYGCRVAMVRWSQVSIIGTQTLARAYKAKAVQPPPVATWGVPSDDGSASCEEDNGSVGCCGAPGGASLAIIEYEKDEAQVRFASPPCSSLLWGAACPCPMQAAQHGEVVLEPWDTVVDLRSVRFVAFFDASVYGTRNTKRNL